MKAQLFGLGVVGALALSACYVEGGVYTCFDDWDCPAGSYCGVDGICYTPYHPAPGCYDDWDCAAGYFCGGDGVCYLDTECTVDAHCGPGEYCGVDGYCYDVPGCRSNYDCAPG